MRRLTSPQQARELPLDGSLLDRLHSELVEQPFGSAEEAITFWQQEEVCLWWLEQSDDFDLCQAVDPQISQLLNCPEFVIPLDESWRLALTIITDSGGGHYLLFPLGLDDRLDRLTDLS
ncbi:hypothetical protein [Motiliproteus sp. SC1-56]|uniref:hypothetical protein n=1 Tax=Motiliproteus sp. SC1-56 TaxID=2799565 RepID=UPI001A8EA6CA|nr:hypothetical protein [Motiliproteus sp. SC1-56]